MKKSYIKVFLPILMISLTSCSNNSSVSTTSYISSTVKVESFYEKNRITYAQYTQYVSEQESGNENQFIVLFYSDTCAHCEAIQKSVRDFYKENDTQKIYTINISDEYYITESEKTILSEQFAPVYNNMATEYKNEDYDIYPISEKILTPTFVVIRNGGPIKVILGLPETKVDVYNALYDILDINNQ